MNRWFSKYVLRRSRHVSREILFFLGRVIDSPRCSLILSPTSFLNGRLARKLIFFIWTDAARISFLSLTGGHRNDVEKNPKFPISTFQPSASKSRASLAKASMAPANKLLLIPVNLWTRSRNSSLSTVPLETIRACSGCFSSLFGLGVSNRSYIALIY